MRDELIIALENSRNIFESEEFLPNLLGGGYELLARNIVYHNLPINQDFATEYPIPNTNLIADLIRLEPYEIAEFGHNGTWQTQTLNTGLINKVNEDRIQFVNVPNIEAIYNVGFLTDIVQINHNEIDQILHYRDAIVNLNRMKAVNKITTVIEEFTRMEEPHGVLQPIVFNNAHNGFIVHIYAFVLGPHLY
jgi:hypothetical protein